MLLPIILGVCSLLGALLFFWGGFAEERRAGI
jgi:hypothetical protein